MNAPEWIQNVVEIISLVWTWPVIILGFGVVLHWCPSVYRSLAKREDLKAHDWLILGVTVSFLGAIVDNAYWGIAWTADYLHSEYRDWWFRHGVYSNVLFRQLAGAYAAYCHMRAYYHGKTANRVNRWFSISVIAGILYGIMLALFKHK